ncbi:MAG: putative ABC transport system ATP-binding protein, partial [Marinoscillum sp.]
SSQGEEVMDMLKELNKDGMTIIQVTHNEKFAGYASKIIELEDGGLKRH